MERLEVQKLSAGSIYKLALVGFTCGLVPLFLLLGIMGALGFDALSWKDQPVTGIGALFVGPVLGLFVACALAAVLGTIMAAGLWVFSKTRTITVEYIPAP